MVVPIITISFTRTPYDLPAQQSAAYPWLQSIPIKR